MSDTATFICVTRAYQDDDQTPQGGLLEPDEVVDLHVGAALDLDALEVIATLQLFRLLVLEELVEDVQEVPADRGAEGDVHHEAHHVAGHSGLHAALVGGTAA